MIARRLTAMFIVHQLVSDQVYLPLMNGFGSQIEENTEE